MSFTPDAPSTEDVLTAVLSSSLPALPPQEQRVGATTIFWWETDPGEVYVHAEGGTGDDRHYGSTLVSLQLGSHGYKRAQFDLDQDVEHPEPGRYTSRTASWPDEPGMVPAVPNRQPFGGDAQVMFHVAPQGFRESIERYGLDWKKGPPGTDYDSLGSEPANYLWPLEDQAVTDQERQDENGIPSDLYEVDVTDLAVTRDPVWTEASRCVDAIPPDRIRRVA